MRLLAPRLGATVLVLASLGAGILTVAATTPAPPAPQPAASAAGPATTAVTPLPTTTPVPTPTTAPAPTTSAPPTTRTTTAAPSSPAPVPSPTPAPAPKPPVIVAQTAQPAKINSQGCDGASSKVTVKLAGPATSVTLHFTGPGGATSSRAMKGRGTTWTGTLGPYPVTGTATWSVTARNAAGDTHGALKTVKVVAC